MPTKYVCPGCNVEVLVPNRAAEIISFDEQIGCNNTEEHEDDDPLVMWEEGNE